MMYIKVHNRHPLKSISRQGVRSAHRDIIEYTKSHGPVAFRMMSRRTYIAKYLVCFAAHDKIHAQYHRAGCM